MANNNKHGLGRGLGALFGEENLNLNLENLRADEQKDLKIVPLSSIEPGVCQPRKEFNAEAISALAESIKDKGVLQPILVRRHNEKYEIIAGERRFRAAKLAGLTQIPVIEKKLADNEALEIGLIENIMRQDLTDLEEAAGLRQLQENFSYTQENLAKVVGKSRSYVTNCLRLLTLPDSVKKLMNENQLSAGHARLLVGLEKAEQAAARIVEKGMSVRQAEEWINQLKMRTKTHSGSKIKNAEKSEDMELSTIENDLSQKFKSKVKIITGQNGKGKIIFSYNDFSELENIIEKLEQ